METEKLNELVAYLTDTIKSSGEYIKETAPEFINELMAYTLITDYIGIAIFGLMLVGLIVWSIILVKTDEAPLITIPALISILPIVLIFIGIAEIIQINVAPKVFILDYLKTLI